MRRLARCWCTCRLLLLVSALATPGQWLFTSMSQRPPSLPVRRPRVARHAETTDQDGAPPDAYRSFLMKAGSEGVREALCYASTTMPKEFCLSFSELKRAAKFVAGLKDDAQASNSGRAAGKASVQPPWRLQVCTKCLKKSKGFDTLDSLRNLQLADTDVTNGEVSVEPTGCLKQCKHGPNVRVVGPEGADGTVVTGMTPEEVRARCFHHVNNTASAEQLFKSVKKAMDLWAGDSSKVQDPGLQAATAVPAVGGRGQNAKDREKRDRIRKSMEDRLANILEGLPVRFSGEDLL